MPAHALLLALGLLATPAPALTSPPTFTPAELANRLALQERWVIGDVRRPASYARRHIRGAVSLPGNELARWAPRLDKRVGVVLYCT